MNVRRLKQTAKDILNHPAQVNMDDWFSCQPDEDSGLSDTVSTASALNGHNPLKHCGTMACIAGWGMARYKEDAKKALKDNDEIEKSAGATIFDLDYTQSTRLFIPGYWPDTYYNQYRAAKTGKGKARVVYNRIMKFIASKGEI